MSELNAVLNIGEEVQAGGETLNVLPLGFGRIPGAVKLVIPLANVFRDLLVDWERLEELGNTAKAAASSDDTANAAKTFSQELQEEEYALYMKWVEVFADKSENIIAFLAYALMKDRAWFDTIGLDEGIALIKAVVKVNKDFFIQKVLKMWLSSPTPSTSQPEDPEAIRGQTS